MSKDREPRYFDFIHQHEERLNQIYSRWEAQIAEQNAINQSRSRLERRVAPTSRRDSAPKGCCVAAEANASRGNPQNWAVSLFGKIGKKKTAVAGMAIAFGTVLLATSECGKVKVNKTAIDGNSQKIALMSQELGYAAAARTKRGCIGNGDIYQLTSGSSSYHSSDYEHRSLFGHSNSIFLTKRSSDIHQPDVHLRIVPYHSLSISSTEQTDSIVQTNTRAIDLNLDSDNLLDRESANNYRATQEEAIAIHEEFRQCFADNGGLDSVQPLPHSVYAD